MLNANEDADCSPDFTELPAGGGGEYSGRGNGPSLPSSRPTPRATTAQHSGDDEAEKRCGGGNDGRLGFPPKLIVRATRGVRVVAFKLRLKLSVRTHFQQKVGDVKPFSGHIIWF
jgi:hypothetical protein